MSKFYLSRSAPSKPSIPQFKFKTKAEVENWFVPYGMLNAEGLRVQGGSIIDVHHLLEMHPVDFTSKNRPSYQTKM